MTDNTESETRETAHRFIPYRKHDIVEMCLQENQLKGQEDAFRELYYLLSNIFHFEFHRIIESIKNSYAPIDPDTDTRIYKHNELPDVTGFIDQLDDLLDTANYERISQDELNQAMNKSSLFKIRLQVDFNDFSEVLLFFRGESTKTETVSSWMGLISKDVTFTNYERVVVYIRFRDDYEDDTGGHPDSKPGATLLKLFQNVPKADLEMLFPNTRIRMRTLDKLLIGVPAVISGGIVLTTKLGASLVLLGSLLGFWFGLSSQPVELNKTALMALLAGVVALGGYLWKQFNNFKNRKLRFMQMLTQNLYFKNLDNNAGVFHRLANDAEEEECKEAILAYYFLLRNSQAVTKTELDQQIESWLNKNWSCQVNFEITDALDKLLNLGLLEQNQNRLTAVPLDLCINKLHQRWDNYLSPGL